MLTHLLPGIRTGLILCFALLSLHCERAGLLEPEPIDDSPTLTDIQSRIFATSCAISGCHASSNPLLGLDLSEGQSYSNLVGVKSKQAPWLFLVNPGKPDSSYLVNKLEGRGIAPGSLIMPMGRPALTEENIIMVREWIAAGASDN